MSRPSYPIAKLRERVIGAAREIAGRQFSAERMSFERPPQAKFGDYSANAAMLMAAGLDVAPREAAEQLGKALQRQLDGLIDRFEVAGPGFLNLFLADAWYHEALAQICAASDFGAGVATSPESINVEFVSANPTGPMHIGHGRHAAYGDSLARTLEFAGNGVVREFYLNDFGSQARLFGESLAARLRQARGERVDLPEGGYEGEYVAELAAEISAANPNIDASQIDELAQLGMAIVVERIKETLVEFRVEMTAWSSERALYESGAPEKALAQLGRDGHTYEHDGALWLCTTKFGDDKDRVLRRSDGTLTYFATDIAYHEQKRLAEPRCDRLIDILGADHHGYVGRVKAAFAALGDDPERLELLIMQLVNVLEGGERARMSKRRGEFETLEDLIAAIGVDAARFFLLQRSHDTPIDLDLDLAREQSPKNPVYYVQYAHARIASILRKAGAEAVERAVAADAKPEQSLHASERGLIKSLASFPEVVEAAANSRAPHKFTTYTADLAAEFTAFYRDCQVIGVEPQPLENFRLALCIATQRTIKQSLALLGVSAPERM